MLSTSQAPVRPRRSKNRNPDWLAAVPFLGVKAVVFTLFVAFPFCYTIYLTFQRGSLLGGMKYAGLDNYRSIISDPLFRYTLTNTALFMALVIPMTAVASCAVGLLLSVKLRGMGVYRVLIYAPSLVSIAVAGLIWKMMVNGDSGPLDWFATKVLQVEIGWLTDGPTAIVFLAFVTMWTGIGFYSLIFMSAFNNVDVELLDAAKIDGASAWQSFVHIKLPLIRPIAQVVLVLITINAVQLFDLVYVMTKGGPGTATYTAMWYVYSNAFNGGSVPYAATMSMVLLAFTAAVAALFLRRSRSEKAGV